MCFTGEVAVSDSRPAPEPRQPRPNDSVHPSGPFMSLRLSDERVVPTLLRAADQMAAQHSITAGRDCRPESLCTSPGETAQQLANHVPKSENDRFRRVVLH